MEGFLVLLALALIVGAIMGWVAVIKLSSLSSRLAELERQLKHFTPSQRWPAQAQEAAPPPPKAAPTSTAAHASGPATQAPPVTPTAAAAAKPQAARQAVPPSASSQRNATTVDKLFNHISENWMIWLGGTCIAFAGIFLAKHSIEQGLLGPAARIVLAIVVGLGLHVAAEVLRRRVQAAGRPTDVFAALAGGASITLYAALLAALHLYQLMSPALVFSLLIVVSLATMLLALWQGPVLAGIGILGAFAVPILVDTGSDNVLGALAYSLIISVSALLLIRFVFRHWLWVGTLVGALGWWLLGLAAPQELPAALDLYLLVLTYAACAIHWWDWQLRPQGTDGSSNDSLLALFKPPLGERRLALLLVIITGLYAVNLAVHPSEQLSVYTAPLLPLMFFWLAGQHSGYRLLPWLTFMASLAGLLFQWIHDSSATPALATLLIELGVIYLAASLWLLRNRPYPGVWASLGFIAPVALLAVAYLRFEQLSLHWQWSVATALLGAVYMHLVYRQRYNLASTSAQAPALIVSLTLAAHFAFSLALVMVLREATLTLALAVQIVSLTWLHRQFGFKVLLWAAKIMLVVILARLSLNPWLLTYPTDVHWSLWTYGGSLLCCVFASRLAIDNFKQWLVGASLHLLVLLLFFEVRYWLYGGDVFQASYGFTEAAINTSLWAALGLVYYWRAEFTESLAFLYRIAAYLLLLLAASNYTFVVLLAKNPLFSDSTVAATPVFNMLLLAYGLPTILSAMGYWLFREPLLKRCAGFAAAATLLVFCTLEIRHLWQGSLSLTGSMSDGELYSYSMGWLALAVMGSVGAIRFNHRMLYKGSMLLLIVVVAKIFLVDLDGLTGLWRAASFMGLGLSLLGLAYLHQYLQTGTPGRGTAEASLG